VINERLSKYYKPGSVRIYVVDPKLSRYYVDGEVNHPGAYCLDAPTTVLEALDISSGFRKRANLSKIRILRGSQLFRFNYKDFRKGKHPEQNILIETGDHIIVR
jgi:protein involved in polysaccharide export with SLBB domain